MLLSIFLISLFCYILATSMVNKKRKEEIKHQKIILLSLKRSLGIDERIIGDRPRFSSVKKKRRKSRNMEREGRVGS